MPGDLFPCPCCGYLTISGLDTYDICEICLWEEDLSQLRFPETGGGANSISLVEAQSNFAAFGASQQQRQGRARPVGRGDVRDPRWRPLNPATDNIERPLPGVDYGATYPDELTDLCYWLPNYWRRK